MQARYLPTALGRNGQNLCTVDLSDSRKRRAGRHLPPALRSSSPYPPSDSYHYMMNADLTQKTASSRARSRKTLFLSLIRGAVHQSWYLSLRLRVEIHSSLQKPLSMSNHVSQIKIPSESDLRSLNRCKVESIGPVHI